MDKKFFTKRILSSGLDEISFGKVRMTTLMSEESGHLFTVEAPDGKSPIKTEKWNFSGTEKDEDGKIHLCGEIFENPMSVSEALDRLEESKKAGNDAEREKMERKIAFAERVISHAIENGIEIGGTGGDGILVSEDCTMALFLPESIFDMCVTNGNGQDGSGYSKKQGFFIYKGLGKRDQALFTRGVIAYKSLTGKFPYTSENLSQRQTDIFDRKFTPTAYVLNGIDEELSDAIDAALSLPIKFERLPGETRYKNEKADAVRAELLKLASSFKTDSFERELSKEERAPELPEEEFNERTKKFTKKRDFRIGVSRFYRRNRTRIFVTAAVVLVALWAFKSFHDTNSLLATSTGLTSTETAATFYTQMHNANVPNIQEIAKGKKMRDFSSIISGFYVMGKEREGYDAKNRTVPPEEWFFNNTSQNLWIYGITHLQIDGKDFESEFDFPRRLDKKKPLDEENGKKLEKGDETSHKARYFFIHTDSSRINIEEISEEIRLQWDGKRWIVKELVSDGKSKARTVKLKELSEEYERLVEESAGSAKKAIETLRQKHEWIPRDEDLSRGAGKLFKKYSIKRAGDFLSGL